MKKNKNSAQYLNPRSLLRSIAVRLITSAHLISLNLAKTQTADKDLIFRNYELS